MDMCDNGDTEAAVGDTHRQTRRWGWKGRTGILRDPEQQQGKASTWTSVHKKELHFRRFSGSSLEETGPDTAGEELLFKRLLQQRRQACHHAGPNHLQSLPPHSLVCYSSSSLESSHRTSPPTPSLKSLTKKGTNLIVCATQKWLRANLFFY